MPLNVNKGFATTTPQQHHPTQASQERTVPKRKRSQSVPNGLNGVPEVPQEESAFPKVFTAEDTLHIRSGRRKGTGFRNRYFCLKHNFLLSARTKQDKKLERIIPIDRAQVFRITQTDVQQAIALGRQSPVRPGANPKAALQLKVFVHPNKPNKSKSYYFDCGTEAVANKWYKLFRKAADLKLTDLYKLGRSLGISASQTSKVISAVERKTGRKVAIKIIDKLACDPKRLQTEVEILKTIKHDCMVELYDMFETGRYLHLIMELCEGGELFDQICSLGQGKHYSEADSCVIIHQIARGVKFMHNKGIVHRDLKPENILCKRKITDVKVADFGISKVFPSAVNDHTLMRTVCGTLSYLAPEVLRGLDYTPNVDCWSIGVIMHILLCGYPPFDGDSEAEVAKAILYEDLVLDEKDWEDVSEAGKNLVLRLLNKDPSKRATLDDILKHSWKEACQSGSIFKSAQNKLNEESESSGKVVELPFEEWANVPAGEWANSETEFLPLGEHDEGEFSEGEISC